MVRRINANLEEKLEAEDAYRRASKEMQRSIHAYKTFKTISERTAIVSSKHTEKLDRQNK